MSSKMSLFLGNLSSHIRRDELERVFQRFGRCNVQLKDGYGFVVYDFPPNAEKALRALRGKNICGEPISLTWSNKQPRPFQRFARGARSYKVQHGRNSARGEDYANRKLGSNGRREYRMGIKQPDSDGGRLNSADMLDEEVSYRHDNIKDYAVERHHNLKEDLPDEGGSVEPNLLDNDRWGEQVRDPSNDHGVENGMEFDRYEPYHGYERRDEDENHQMSYSGGSPILGDSQEKTGKEHIGGVTLNRTDIPKPQQKCYFCGESGHEMRNCPRENASQRKKFTRFDPRRDDQISYRGRVEGELERLGSKSRGRLRLTRDNILMRRHRNDRKAFGSGKHRRLIKSGRSPIENKTHRARRKDYEGRKRSRREDGTPKSHHAKKARASVSSPLHSDYTASRSLLHLQSLKSVPGSSSRSRSRSVSSRICSFSSSSRSSSASRYSRSGSFKSRSRSSSPTSLSLSVSLGRPLPSPPNKVQMNLKGSFDNATSPESKEVVVEQGQQVANDAGLENSKLDTTVALNNEIAMSSFKAEDNLDKDHPQQRDVDGNRTMLPIPDVAKNPCTLPLEKGAFTTRRLSPESLRETRELQNSGALVMEHRLAPTNKPDSEAPVSSRTCNSTSVSPEEMYMVLKHYGLEHPEENERQLPVEAYFGSARLWPWEIIYYRRLRKGPISTDNYARRITQNREFGIVDKYIRSSSGWGELGQDNS